MKSSELTLMGQYIKDLSFENPMAPNLPSQNKNPTVNLDINTTYLDLKNNIQNLNLQKNQLEIEKNELLVLDKYMPEMMSEEAINELVTKTISELGAAGPQDMGKVMGHLKGSVGDSADMGLVSKIVKEKLI